MKHIIFKYRKEKTKSNLDVYRPVAYVYIKGQDGNWYFFDPYVDSGADLPLFTKSDCMLLGHELEKGEERLIGGVGGTLIRCFVHNLDMKIGDNIFRTKAAF